MLIPWDCPLRDLSMILCDPFAINTLSLSTVRHLQELVGQETLPRVSALGWRLAAFWVGVWLECCGQAYAGPGTAHAPHTRVEVWGPVSKADSPGLSARTLLGSDRGWDSEGQVSLC